MQNNNPHAAMASTWGFAKADDGLKKEDGP